MGILRDNEGSHLLKAGVYPRYPLKHRYARSLFLEKNMAWAWFPSGTWWGSDMMKRLNIYSGILDEILDKNSVDITNLNLETRAIRKQLELHDLLYAWFPEVLNLPTQLQLIECILTFIMVTRMNMSQWEEISH